MLFPTTIVNVVQASREECVTFLHHERLLVLEPVPSGGSGVEPRVWFFSAVTVGAGGRRAAIAACNVCVR